MKLTFTIVFLFFVSCLFAYRVNWSEDQKANWWNSLDKNNHWSVCKEGFLMVGLYRNSCDTLKCIEEARCKKPGNFLATQCYEKNVQRLFDRKKAATTCDTDYFLSGIYRGNCDKIYCIESFKCCKVPGKYYWGESSTPSADWGKSFDHKGWSYVPENTYITGFWRNKCNKIYCIERAYYHTMKSNEPRQHSERRVVPWGIDYVANWWSSFDRKGWSKCSSGYLMVGLRRNKCNDLKCIEQADCRKPGSLEAKDCKTHNVWSAFDQVGVTSCPQNYYLSGLWRNDCEKIFCIEKFQCCRVNNRYFWGEGRNPSADWQKSFNHKGWSRVPKNTFLTGFKRSSCSKLYCIEEGIWHSMYTPTKKGCSKTSVRDLNDKACIDGELCTFGGVDVNWTPLLSSNPQSQSLVHAATVTFINEAKSETSYTPEVTKSIQRTFTLQKTTTKSNTKQHNWNFEFSYSQKISSEVSGSFMGAGAKVGSEVQWGFKAGVGGSYSATASLSNSQSNSKTFTDSYKIELQGKCPARSRCSRQVLVVKKRATLPYKIKFKCPNRDINIVGDIEISAEKNSGFQYRNLPPVALDCSKQGVQLIPNCDICNDKSKCLVCRNHYLLCNNPNCGKNDMNKCILPSQCLLKKGRRWPKQPVWSDGLCVFCHGLSKKDCRASNMCEWRNKECRVYYNFHLPRTVSYVFGASVFTAFIAFVWRKHTVKQNSITIDYEEI